MNLLLLLSALLSAISGMGQVVRGVQAPETVCTSTLVTRAVTAATIRVATRPVHTLPRLADAPRLILSAWRLLPIEPGFAQRRRE